MRHHILILAGAALLTSCSRGGDASGDSAAASVPTIGSADSATPAAANSIAMRDSTGRDLGTLTLSDASGGIMIMGSLRGLPPGEHAIHLHTTGSCEPTFAAAGGHWNPTSKEHGKDNPKGPHLGDMLNITVGADSSVSIHVVSPGGSLSGQDALLDADGASVVVHAKPDDYKSQPAGNAGDRIACGAIKQG